MASRYLCKETAEQSFLKHYAQLALKYASGGLVYSAKLHMQISVQAGKLPAAFEVSACECTVFLTQEDEDRLTEDKPSRENENAKETENPLAVLKGILSEVWYVKSSLLQF